MQSAFPHFPHRSNKDGSIDSICSRCFATIGNANSESELEGMEAAHVCEPAQLRLLEEERQKKLFEFPHFPPGESAPDHAGNPLPRRSKAV
jgi:hypothetical protein